MMISKLFWNSVEGMCNISPARIRCPVDDIGRNSVIPSIIPKIRAWMGSMRDIIPAELRAMKHDFSNV